MEEINSVFYTGLIAKYLKKEITEFEQNLLLEWIEEDASNKRYFLQTRKIWEITATDPFEFSADTNVAWKKVKMKLEGLSHEMEVVEQEVPKVISIKPNWATLKYAASFLLLAGIGYILFIIASKADFIEISTAANQKKEFYLPDSSRVWLKENSKFSYAADFTQQRRVKLDGEAYFEVKKYKKKSFTITSSRATTEVLGTSFDIRSYENDSIDKIEVFTGKVAVESVIKGKSSRKYLLPGMKAELRNNNEVVVNKFVLANALSWKDEKLLFDNTKMVEVVQAIENYFKIQIEFNADSLAACRFTGTFEKPSLKELQEVLSVSSNLVLVKKQNHYALAGQGCKN